MEQPSTTCSLTPWTEVTTKAVMPFAFRIKPTTEQNNTHALVLRRRMVQCTCKIIPSLFYLTKQAGSTITSDCVRYQSSHTFSNALKTQ